MAPVPRRRSQPHGADEPWASSTVAGAPRCSHASSRRARIRRVASAPISRSRRSGSRFEVRRVGTRPLGGHVHVPPPVVELDDLARPPAGRQPVEHMTVVGHQDECRPGGRQPGLEPLDGFEVEMVGRLVEHDQVVLTDERLGERDALGLATGELVGPAVEQRLDAERGRHRRHLPSTPPSSSHPLSSRGTRRRCRVEAGGPGRARRCGRHGRSERRRRRVTSRRSTAATASTSRIR